MKKEMAHLMKLSSENFIKAKTFINSKARSLDQKLFKFYFENGSVADVIEELEKFQNDDGGFGKSIEPDFRLDISSPMATTIGLQYARELNLTSNHQTVQRAIRYLLKSFNEKQLKWIGVPKEVNDVPRAPWWNYDVAKVEGGQLPFANPSAEIVGYLHEYSDLVPPAFLEMVTDIALNELNQLPHEIEIHDFFCYQRLLEMIPRPNKEGIYEKLKLSVRDITVLDPDKWGGYGAKPLQIASSPQSDFINLLEKEVQLNLDYEINAMSAEGSWNPTWSWFGQYDEVWKQAKQDWKGCLTVNNLKILANFGRIETADI